MFENLLITTNGMKLMLIGESPFFVNF